MNKFKVGDKVVKKSGVKWSGGGEAIATVQLVEGDRIWVLEPGTWVYDITLDFAVDVVQPPEPPLPCTTEATEEHTGGSSSYYTVEIKTPIAKYKLPYTAECIDIQEALNMTPAEANAFKAVWRTAAARMGKKKKGNSAVYDAEKVIFQGERMLVAAKKVDKT